MTSPQLNEKMIVDTFDCTKVSENAQRLSAGGFMVALDAYDRKAIRTQFIAALASTTSLYDALGRLAVVDNIRTFIQETGDFSLADLESAAVAARDLVEKHANDCLKMAKLLEQCPMDEDKIH